MSKRVTKKNVKEEANPVILAIFIVFIITTIKGCGAYCSTHYEQWQEEMKKNKEQRIQESFYNCKFEHDPYHK